MMLKAFRTAAGAAVLTFGVAACGTDRPADDPYTAPATAPAPAPEPAPMAPAPYDPAPGVQPADTLGVPPADTLGTTDPAAPGTGGY